MKSLFPMSELSVMGLLEVLPHARRIMGRMREAAAAVDDLRPGAVITIDSPGFAHGFVTRTPDTEIVYKCSDTYAPETEGALLWNDPDIGIDWGLGGDEPVLSDKDAAAARLAGFDSPFTWEGGA